MMCLYLLYIERGGRQTEGRQGEEREREGERERERERENNGSSFDETYASPNVRKMNGTELPFLGDFLLTKHFARCFASVVLLRVSFLM